MPDIESSHLSGSKLPVANKLVSSGTALQVTRRQALMSWGAITFLALTKSEAAERPTTALDGIRNLTLEIKCEPRLYRLGLPKKEEASVYFDPALKYKAHSVKKSGYFVILSEYKSKGWYRGRMSIGSVHIPLYTRAEDYDFAHGVFVAAGFSCQRPIHSLLVYMDKEKLKGSFGRGAIPIVSLKPNTSRSVFIPFMLQPYARFDKAEQERILRDFTESVSILVSLDGSDYYSVPISLMREERAQAAKPCPRCRGKKTLLCPQCKGTGDPVRNGGTTVEQIMRNAELRAQGVYCGNCKNPQGRLTCPTCDGIGEFTQKPTVLLVPKLQLTEAVAAPKELQIIAQHAMRRPPLPVKADTRKRVEEAVKALIDNLNGKDDTIRKEAISALGDIGPAAKAAVPALIELMKDKDASVRLRAKSALQKIDPKAIP